jgi:hypothetical protein
MANSMSTPIQTLPNQGPTTVTSSAEDEPIVKELLADMNATAVRPGTPPSPAGAGARLAAGTLPANQHLIAAAGPAFAGPYMSYADVPSTETEWWNPVILKDVIVAAVLAFVIFHPNTFEAIYRAIPRLSVLAVYETMARPLLFAMLLYIIFIRVPL